MKQCPVVCTDFSMMSCHEPHQCVLDEGHPFDPVYGDIHEFVTHLRPVKPRKKDNEENETLTL